jgi:hypothetical protein
MFQIDVRFNEVELNDELNVSLTKGKIENEKMNP